MKSQATSTDSSLEKIRQKIQERADLLGQEAVHRLRHNLYKKDLQKEQDPAKRQEIEQKMAVELEAIKALNSQAAPAQQAGE